jgi:hypothetical protein
MTSLDLSATNVTLANLHLETALKLTSREFVEKWLAGDHTPTHTPNTSPDTITLVASPTESVATKRGRKPGAATSDLRCIWKMTTGEQCKNKRYGTSEYCRIHISKTHIIAPTPQ